jgi:hypothetical protein
MISLFLIWLDNGFFVPGWLEVMEIATLWFDLVELILCVCLFFRVYMI